MGDRALASAKSKRTKPLYPSFSYDQNIETVVRSCRQPTWRAAGSRPRATARTSAW